MTSGYEHDIDAQAIAEQAAVYTFKQAANARGISVMTGTNRNPLDEDPNRSNWALAITKQEYGQQIILFAAAGEPGETLGDYLSRHPGTSWASSAIEATRQAGSAHPILQDLLERLSL